MKNLDVVKNIITQLKTLVENKFELHRIEVLERDLIEGLPKAEVVDDLHQKFDGEKFTITKSGHYLRHRSIHQAIWQYYCGEIPQVDCQIHHIDWNSSNNTIENLQLLTTTEHRRIHANRPTFEVSEDKVEQFTCQRCGATFRAAKRQGHRFCCRECQRLAQLDAKKIHTKTCLYCGKEFAGTEKSKFCSRKCKVEFAKSQVPTKICPQCGKEFRAYSQSGKRKHYCSRECMLVAKQLSAKNIVRDDDPNLRVVTCKNCGKEFQTNHPLKCFCSQECNLEWQKKKIHNIKKICPACNKEFWGTKRQKYCSWECRDEAHRTGRKIVEKACPICGKTFGTNDKRVKYCSKECYRISKNSAPRVLPRKKFAHTCLQCGKSFMTTDKNSKYCSKECYHTATRTLHDKVCPTCGKIFRPSGKARKFCSRECIRHERPARTEIIKVCPVCGKEFKARDNRSIHCSRECAAKARRNTLRTCPVCGKEFYDKPEKQVHCSRHCANIARRTPNKKCLVCGKEFHPLHAVKSKFCSQECARTPLKNIGGKEHTE